LFQCSITNFINNLLIPSVILKIHKDIEIIIQTIATALIIYLLFNKKNDLLDSMNNRFFKYTIFLAVGIVLSTTLFLIEFEKNNNNFLLAQEQEKPSNSINNENLQSSSTIINSHTNKFKESIPIEELNEISTISNNHNDYASELTIHIPKGSFHPATHRSFNPDEIIINKGQTITWINEDKAPHTITSKGKLLFDSLLKQDEDFTYKFDKVGTFEFGCTLHPWMHETINVI
jgi:plastocyanin